MKANSLSLCICTYRRAEGLRRALDSLAACTKPAGRPIEIIVVENDAAETTRHVVDSFLARHPDLEVKYVVEAVAGIVAARNRCLMESSGEWVTFIDDDEYVDAAWLVELIAVQERTDADAVFGPVLPDFSTPAPSWVAKTGAYMRKRHRSGAMIGWRDARTGNVLLRRSLASRVGGFDLSFQLTGAEDSAFFAMASRAGGRLAWADAALVFETIPADRVSRRWLCRRSFHGSRNYVRVLGRLHGRRAFAQEFAKGAIGLPVYAVLLLLSVMTGSLASVKWCRRLCASWGKLAASWAVDAFYARA